MKPVLYLAAALMLGGCAAQMQPASEPPVKMGLWEQTMDIRRIKPPMFGTYKYQVCLTPETWRDFLLSKESAEKQKQPDCDMQNLKEGASEFSYDMTCKKVPDRFGSSDSSSHVQIVILNPEKFRRKSRSEYAESSGPFVLESLADSNYQGADCKGIAPGEFKRISGTSAPPASAASQPASGLPVKMGLWELTMDPAKTTADKDMDLDPKTFMKQLCLTPETWRDVLAGMKLQSIAPGCDVNNLTQDASGFSYDWVCEGLRGNNSGHAQLDILNPEKVHLTNHLIYSSDDQKQVVSHLVYDIAYKGADCGIIASGSYKRPAKLPEP